MSIFAGKCQELFGCLAQYVRKNRLWFKYRGPHQTEKPIHCHITEIVTEIHSLFCKNKFMIINILVAHIMTVKKNQCVLIISWSNLVDLKCALQSNRLRAFRINRIVTRGRISNRTAL